MSTAPHNEMGSYTLSDCSNGGNLTPPHIKVTFTSSASYIEDVLINLSDDKGFLSSEVAKPGGGYTATPDVNLGPGGNFSQVLYLTNGTAAFCQLHPYVSDTVN
ncbi:hypothetical protein [Streptacidiphilus sp. P02-A3a]|uniref:hypothetical protein n=1 Tax=Streptacidiphilus sp. P02-A3a TaxID=2704468 RepID=UPI0015FD8231|nr:hypothetical protein [Streptacidiphilus sp. P02-A3a]QMU71240.1 hypothetical protein GXP74_26470 [Streptacidiphilus sp. P02-A3a]